MKILHAASECVPLAKTGGLADVVGALPLAQRALGDEARVVLPGYRGLRAQLASLRVLARLNLRGRAIELLGGTLHSGLPVYLVECPALFDRDGDPYRDAAGQDFADNAERFACFSEAVAQLALGVDTDFVPDLLHLHDWQAGLAAAFLLEQPQRPRVVYTIHNLAYQGVYTREQFAALGLPWSWWTPQRLEFWDQWSFAKAGLALADAITTVSPSYAREILTPEFGCGFDGLLQARAADLHGIINGIDNQAWDPASDVLLDRRYGIADVQAGKAANKQALQTELGLTISELPLVTFIGRLATQKGADLILQAADALLELPAQYAVLAAGDAQLQDGLRDWALCAPAGRVAVRIGYDERLAHCLYAASDLLLMPSRFEPCGLNQLYAQRYGCLPVVRSTGGLIDTVVDATDASLADGSASGVRFEQTDAAALRYGVSRGLQLLQDVARRERLLATMMAQDRSWQSSARRYRQLYQQLLGGSAASTRISN